MSLSRRYEVLVPLVFNDGTPVPESLLAETFAELRGTVWGRFVGNPGSARVMGTGRLRV